MGAPSGHGQRNKGHNTGRHASKSTRNKHKTAGDGAMGTEHRKTIKVRAASPPFPLDALCIYTRACARLNVSPTFRASLSTSCDISALFILHSENKMWMGRSKAAAAAEKKQKKRCVPPRTPQQQPTHKHDPPPACSFHRQTGVGIGNKAERALRAKQIRDARRMEILEEKRSSRSAPKVVAILALNGDVNLSTFIGDFAAAAGVADAAAVSKAMAAAPNVPVTFNVERHRHRLTLLAVRPENPMAALEVIKVADLLLVVSPVTGTGTSGNGNNEDEDDAMITKNGGAAAAVRAAALGEVEASAEVAATLLVLRAQGLPPAICALQGLEAVPHKKRAATRNAATAAVQKALQLPMERVKAVPADSRAEQLELVRQVAEQRGTQPRWRAQRAYLLAERAHVAPEPPAVGASAAEGSETVTVTVKGYVRGTMLSANQLVHLPGVGDFPVERISSVSEPCGNGRKAGAGGERGGGGGGSDAMMGDALGATADGATLQVPDPQHREVPVRENIPDTLAGEQTWPTEEEMAEAGNGGKKDADGPVKRKPKGWSDYQAAWIPDSDSEGDYNSDEDVTDDDEEEGGEGAGGMDTDMAGGGGSSKKKSQGNNFGDEAEKREGGGELGSDDDEDDEWVNQGDGAGDDESELDEETTKNMNEVGLYKLTPQSTHSLLSHPLSNH
jgi:hypothetical protein